jgi:pyruvate/2-oxoglutarate dehydrogenase complex dihydrolipoamide dehydrogenase (E3) component
MRCRLYILKFNKIGCVPSKSLIASAKAAKMATNYAIQHSNKNNNNNNNIDDENNNDDDTHHRKKIRANFDQVRTYFQEKQESIYEADDSPKALKKYGIDTTEGRKACLTSPTTLSFLSNDCDDSDSKRTTTIVEAKDGILLCTGAKPNRPTSRTIPGLSDIDYLTYEEIWTRDFGGDGTLPNRWTVIGGGPIGCELAQALSRLGAQVTIVTGSSGRLLSNVDDVEVSQLMKEVFEEDENIKVVSGRLSKVEPSINKNDDNDRKTSRHVAYVKVEDSDETDGQQEVTVEGDVMLLSIGRIPNTEGLGLETVGIDIDEITGGIVVNDSLQTTVEGIYAAGDCTGDKQFTHYAGTSFLLLLLLLLLLVLLQSLNGLHVSYNVVMISLISYGDRSFGSFFFLFFFF